MVQLQIHLGLYRLHISTFVVLTFLIFSALLYIAFLFPSGGGWFNFLCGLIKPNRRLVVHEIKILPSLLTTKNGISSIHLVSGCMIYKLQDPIILGFLFVYVPNCKSLGAILAQSASLKKKFVDTYWHNIYICACVNSGLQEPSIVLVQLDFEFQICYQMFWPGYLSLAHIALPSFASKIIHLLWMSYHLTLCTLNYVV